jgi:hypothetical protein
MNEDGRPELPAHARFLGPPPAGMESLVDVAEIRAFQKQSKGPAALAIHLRESLRQRIEGVSDDIDDVVEFGAHIGQFAVQHDRRAVRVLVVWLSLPEHRFWVLSIRPQRTRRKRRREQDLELASHVRSHLDEILTDHPEVSGIVWMTDDEAQAYSL